MPLKTSASAKGSKIHLKEGNTDMEPKVREHGD